MLANKLLEAAGNATQPAYIEDVFSTYLYTGDETYSRLTITNNIDLSGKGGLVWIKSRSAVTNNRLFDTARGVNYYIDSNDTNSSLSTPYGLDQFNNNGFRLVSDGGSNFGINASGQNYVSWTFRKQPKFFDVVTYTGDGTAGRQIAHSLNSSIGAIIVKNTNVARDWAVWHRSLADGTYLKLNTTDAAITNTSFQVFGDASGQTSTYFTVGKSGSGVNGLTNANASGETYVAYLFAHNAGGFGLTGTDNVISCGSYTGTGDYTGPFVDLGFEPQWLLIKSAGSVKNWVVLDNMRGLTADGTNEGYLVPNTSDQEYSGQLCKITSTGFQANGSSMVAANGVPYIYIAIRRGPMKVPTSGTSVFSPNTATYSANQVVTTGFPVDMLMMKGRTITLGTLAYDRLRGLASTNTSPVDPQLITSDTSAETSGDYVNTANNTGYQISPGFSGFSSVNWNFRRAPSFFDEVCYTGNGGSKTVAHNLAVAPELIIIKGRDQAASWWTYSATLGYTQSLRVNVSDAASSGETRFGSSNPTSSNFYVDANSAGGTNSNGYNYVSYLFATCAGVSKVGSYTGTGTTKQVDCGFTGGARFVLIKRTDSTGDWYVWDSARGIVSANDPHLSLNTTAAEVTTDDTIDTDSTGFIVNQVAATNVNVTSATYIYLAIA